MVNTNAVPLIAIATVAAAAYMLMAAQQGSGAGTITTENTDEGSAMDLAGLGNQLMDAMTPAPTDNPTRMSGQGLAALQRREGFSATPYADHKGYSIGYGHLIKPGENISSVTVAQAMDLLATDVAWAESSVCSAITVPINQGQFDALCSFAYNVGEGAFKRSTLVRRINAGDPGASDEFGRWVYASGVVNQALVARRVSEQSQFDGATA